VPEKGHFLRPKDVYPTVLTSDIGCGEWSGTSGYELEADSTTEKVTAKVVWGRYHLPGLEVRGLGGFHVKRATFTYETSGSSDYPEKCTWSGQDSWSYDEAVDLESERPSGNLTFFYEAIGGVGLRAYFGAGGGDHTVTITKTCQTPDGPRVETEQKGVSWWESSSEESPDLPPHVSAGGKTAAGDSNWGGTYDWNFQATGL
jgi:hypothetical protein